MKSSFLTGLLAITTMAGLRRDVCAQQPSQSPLNGTTAKTSREFAGEKTLWHGFDRFDFLMDDTALKVRPIKASSDEGTGVYPQVEGQLRCVVVIPKEAAQGKPWSWRGRYFDHEPQAEIKLLKRGFHIVTGPRPRDPSVTVLQEWNALYKYLVGHGFSPKPAMEGAGAAAGEAYDWAIANPDKVSCIYGENPILRNYTSKTRPLDHLAPLAKAGVPLLHVCGSLDPWLETQTRVAQKRYEELGGQITVIIKDGEGH